MNCANHPEREKVAFCQNCGKPLCQECTRNAGSAVFCEPCLVAKLGGTGAPSPGGTHVYTGGAAVPPPRILGEPNPGLAALLGFIPGVGAMYNGQYAKGVVHLVVFAILISLADQNGIFGLFIAGWFFYQVIEAYQTARARRDGTPLPNPFGLNDLGERLGFGKAWPSAAPSQPGVPYSNVAAAGTPVTPADNAAVPPYPPPAGSWDAAGGASSAASGASAWNPPSNAPWGNDTYANYGVPSVPPPYASSGYPIDPAAAPIPNRFPSGALWLIGLGCIFLVSNTGLLHGFPIHRIVPFLLIALGVWLFVHKMTDGGGLTDDGTPAYRYRLFCALQRSVWLMVIGVLYLLDSFHILSWGHSWPLMIIVAGVMAVFRRMSYPPSPYPYAAYAVPPVPPAPAPAPAAPGTSIIPSSRHDQEGS